MIDHLVYAAAALPLASAAITELLGVAPTPGGSHVGRGTRNELVSLGGATYLEIIGPDPDQPEPEQPRPFGIDTIVGTAADAALVAWCARPTRPLDDIVAAARQAGIELGPVAQMSRRRPDGVLLEWSLTFPQLDGPFGCALPFLIDWGRSPHPTDTLPAGATLSRLDVTHPDPVRLGAALDLIGVSAAAVIHNGDAPALRATIATGRGEISLTSSPSTRR